MTIQSYKLGPGTLTFDGIVGPDVSAQITKGAITPTVNKSTTAAIPVLSGEEVPEEHDVSYAWTLDGTLLQDISTAGFIAWTWANKGLFKSFTFVPNTVADRRVTGFIRVDPVVLGGDVKTRPTSDFSFDVTDADGLADDPVFEDIP